jgi:ubiquinone biosynthesis protein COQ9
MNASIHSPEAKDLVIANMLKHVPTLGWTTEALAKAVIDTGFAEGDEQRIFLGSVDRALEHYLKMIDRQMEDKLTHIDLTSMRVSDRVATGVMIRLRLIEEHKEAVRKSLIYLASPLRSNLALKGLFNTVDMIWYAAGDQATDFNYYSKRFLLAGVYSATLLYWLDDDSIDSVATRAYLNRRLDEVMMIPKMKEKIKNTFPFSFFSQ